MVWQANKNFDVNKNFHAESRKLAAAIISNCNDNSARREYVSEMQKYAPIDVYGRCGQECTKILPNGTTFAANCIDVQDFKFYLAFENSVCDEYITEKFFQQLRSNTIPVVLGGGDYSRFVIFFSYFNNIIKVIVKF